MRAVHISKVKGIAGSEQHLLMLLPGLAAHGVEVSMLVLEEADGSAGEFCEALAERGIPARRVPIRGHLDPALPGRLAAELRAARPDLVHTHLLHADLYGLPAARRAGVPHAISSRHNDNPFRRNPVLKLANRLAMRRADRVIAISHALADFVRGVEGIEPDKVVTIHYGLQPREYPPDVCETARAAWGIAPDAPLIGYFGRLIEQKGVDVLIEAFARVRREHGRARLVIVGDGDLRPALEEQARVAGVGDAVHFAGWVADAARLMPACDVIAMPSRWEGFGLVALEAMSAARPLVASRVSALPEIVDDPATGRLVPPDDAGALAAALGDLLADPARAAAMGRAGRERLVQAFAVDTMVQATLDVYRSVVTAGRG